MSTHASSFPGHARVWGKPGVQQRQANKTGDGSVFGLASLWPEFSARTVFTPAQIFFLVAGLLAFVTAAFAKPQQCADAVVFLMALGFLYGLFMRCLLAWLGHRRSAHHAHSGLEDFPLYSILVPVFHEADMVPQIAHALGGLDYPADKLDISLVLEEDDSETRAAVERAQLRSIIVPYSLPRTKPKACNYALRFARGEFVVVYDAEDRPDPDQLRKAVAAFRAFPDVSCFQARLTIDRARVWIARMFAVDYALWFRILLLGLDRIAAPIPLGGTSNHFRTEALREAGAWDPYNVTEDADLGLRLARLGHRVAILESSTREEAPVHLATWLRQRTRWMKGYMQTLLVHTRHPVRLVQSIGVKGTIVILGFLGGAVWSALVNPLMWVFCIAAQMFSTSGPSALDWLARISGLTLLAANCILAGLAMVQAQHRTEPSHTVIILSYPVYWLLISLATYRALWQLLRDPFRWEKTPHRVSVP